MCELNCHFTQMISWVFESRKSVQRVNLHAIDPLIQVGCPICCYQAGAQDHAKQGPRVLDYPSKPCLCNRTCACISASVLVKPVFIQHMQSGHIWVNAIWVLCSLPKMVYYDMSVFHRIKIVCNFFCLRRHSHQILKQWHISCACISWLIITVTLSFGFVQLCWQLWDQY